MADDGVGDVFSALLGCCVGDTNNERLTLALLEVPRDCGIRRKGWRNSEAND